MKLTTTNREITRIGAGRETGFKIAANAQAFDILSSKLYTDIKLAIVRELSTNAYDSQVEAGNTDKPFDVHLPNSIEPFFSIRDYGTGLSQNDLETIYTTYFESTRNNSNDYTGALGLGSKSPFAYTDMFMVTSHYNGTKFVYSAFKSESGSPSIRLMEESATSQPNGIEIRIEVKRGDEHDFYLAARKVYAFFKTRPNVTGMRFDIPVSTPVVEGNGYEFFDGMPYGIGGYTKIHVVMGNVRYVAEKNIDHNISGYGTLIVHAKIGDCTVSASREELHYDDKTIRNVQNLVNVAEADIAKQIRAKVAGANSLLEEVIALKDHSSIFNVVAKSDERLFMYKKDHWSLRQAQVISNKLRINNSVTWDTSLRPNRGSVYYFVENDLEKMKQSDKNKLRHWIQQQSGRGVIYLSSIENRAEFIKTFGKPVVKMSELPDAPKTVRAGGYARSGGFVKEMAYALSCRMADKWENVTDPDTTKAIAVRRKGHYVIWNGNKVNPAQIHGIATKLGYTHVYGIAASYFDRICKELEIEDLEVKAKAYLTAEIAKMDKYTTSRYHHNFRNEMTNDMYASIKGLSTECDDLIAMSKATVPCEIIKRLCWNFSVSIPEQDDFVDLFKKRYPLLSGISLRYANIDDVTEYIALKEKK